MIMSRELPAGLRETVLCELELSLETFRERRLHRIRMRRPCKIRETLKRIAAVASVRELVRYHVAVLTIASCRACELLPCGQQGGNS
jgi:hypothetical protein